MLNELFTERLILKAVDDSASGQVLSYVLRNKEFLGPWEIERNEDYYTHAAQQKMLSDDMRKIQNGELFKVWIYTIQQPDRIIGSVALSNIVRGAFQSCHLGYRIDKDECNKGYMAEALRKIIHYGFNELGLHRIEANIMPRNKASMKLIGNLGFYHEGLALKYLKINGVWEDHIHMVLRNTDLEEEIEY
jgi:[ribosomal protein S5]-alanine N-acetyltransferase